MLLQSTHREGRGEWRRFIKLSCLIPRSCIPKWRQITVTFLYHLCIFKNHKQSLMVHSHLLWIEWINRQIWVQLLPLFARIWTRECFTRFILVVRSSMVPTDPGSRLQREPWVWKWKRYPCCWSLQIFDICSVQFACYCLWIKQAQYRPPRSQDNVLWSHRQVLNYLMFFWYSCLKNTISASQFWEKQNGVSKWVKILLMSQKEGTVRGEAVMKHMWPWGNSLSVGCPGSSSVSVLDWPSTRGLTTSSP